MTEKERMKLAMAKAKAISKILNTMSIGEIDRIERGIYRTIRQVREKGSDEIRPNRDITVPKYDVVSEGWNPSVGPAFLRRLTDWWRNRKPIRLDIILGGYQPKEGMNSENYDPPQGGSGVPKK